MTTGCTGRAGLEVLTFGGSPPGPHRFTPGRRLSIVLVLLGGMLLGGWTGAEVTAQTNPEVVLVAGPLREVGDCSPRCLELALRNAGTQDVAVVPLALGGAAVSAGSDAAVVAEAGSWTSLVLDVPVICELPRPALASTVTLRVSSGSTRLVILPVTTGADVPALRHDRLCVTGRAPESADLHGWWLRDDDAALPSDVEGSSRIHFRPGGAFAVWSVDRVRGPRLVVRGRYHLAGRLLTLTVPLQPGCTPAPTATWRVTLVGRHGLHLAHTGGTTAPCVLPPGETWTAHRVAVVSGR